jgi:hypothetical protein
MTSDPLWHRRLTKTSAVIDFDLAADGLTQQEMRCLERAAQRCGGAGSNGRQYVGSRS